jgi:hypothetical protein
MDRRTAKEFLHLRDWLYRAQGIVEAGKSAYDGDELRQEAGDSLMMKIGEAANRLSRAGVASPEGDKVDGSRRGHPNDVGHGQLCGIRFPEAAPGPFELR